MSYLKRKFSRKIKPAEFDNHTDTYRLLETVFHLGYNKGKIPPPDSDFYVLFHHENMEFCRMVSFLATLLKESLNLKKDIPINYEIFEWQKFLIRTDEFLEQFRDKYELKVKFRDLDNFNTRLDLLKFLTGVIMNDQITYVDDVDKFDVNASVIETVTVSSYRTQSLDIEEPSPHSDPDSFTPEDIKNLLISLVSMVNSQWIVPKNLNAIIENLEYTKLAALLAEELKEQYDLDLGITNITDITEWNNFIENCRKFLEQFHSGEEFAKKLDVLSHEQLKIQLLKFLYNALDDKFKSKSLVDLTALNLSEFAISSSNCDTEVIRPLSNIVITILTKIFTLGYIGKPYSPNALLIHFEENPKNLEFAHIISFFANNLKVYCNFERGIIDITDISYWDRFVEMTGEFLKQFDYGWQIIEEFQELEEYDTKLELIKFLYEELYVLVELQKASSINTKITSNRSESPKSTIDLNYVYYTELQGIVNSFHAETCKTYSIECFFDTICHFEYKRTVISQNDLVSTFQSSNNMELTFVVYFLAKYLKNSEEFENRVVRIVDISQWKLFVEKTDLMLTQFENDYKLSYKNKNFEQVDTKLMLLRFLLNELTNKEEAIMDHKDFVAEKINCDVSQYKKKWNVVAIKKEKELTIGKKFDIIQKQEYALRQELMICSLDVALKTKKSGQCYEPSVYDVITSDHQNSIKPTVNVEIEDILTAIIDLNVLTKIANNVQEIPTHKQVMGNVSEGKPNIDSTSIIQRRIGSDVYLQLYYNKMLSSFGVTDDSSPSNSTVSSPESPHISNLYSCTDSNTKHTCLTSKTYYSPQLNQENSKDFYKRSN